MNIERYKNGLWINNHNYLLFVNEQGVIEDIEGLTEDMPKLIGYVVSREGYQVKSSQKVFKNLKEAVMDATKKLRTKQNQSNTYAISTVNLSRYNVEFTKRILLISHSKLTDTFRVENEIYDCGTFKNIKLSRQQSLIIQNNLERLPFDWIYSINRKSPTFELEENIKSMFPIRSIYFKQGINIAEKKGILQTLSSILNKISEKINWKEIKPFSLKISGTRKKNAFYDWRTTTITLNQYSLKSIIHELFHHIDRTNDKHCNEIQALRDLTYRLQKEATLLTFQEHRKVNDMSKKFENYYLSIDEVCARFFSDYILYDSEIKQDLSDFLNHSFSVEEINKHKHLMEEYLSEHNLLLNKY